MSGFTPEELRAVGKLTPEKLEYRRDGAKAMEEEARHDRQLCEHELRWRWMRAYQEAKG